jgi:hypothetical protein
MKPSIGRIVHVPATPDQNNGSPVAPAVITRVWSDTCVNVRVLLDGPDTPWRTSVSHVEDLDDAAHSHCWTWPPRT